MMHDYNFMRNDYTVKHHIYSDKPNDHNVMLHDYNVMRHQYNVKRHHSPVKQHEYNVTWHDEREGPSGERPAGGPAGTWSTELAGRGGRLPTDNMGIGIYGGEGCRGKRKVERDLND